MTEYQPGDIANGHILGDDLVWRPVKARVPAPPANEPTEPKQSRFMSKAKEHGRAAANRVRDEIERQQEERFGKGAVMRVGDALDTRVFLYEDHLVGQDRTAFLPGASRSQTKIYYRDIQSVDWGQQGFGLTKIVRITDGGRTHEFSFASLMGGSLTPKRFREFRDFLDAKIGAAKKEAASPTVIVAPTPIAPAPAPTAAADEIRALAELRDQGILTNEEFEAKKRQLLGL